GHRAAAGFTAENAKLPVLKEALVRRAAEELAGIELMPVLDIDAQVPLHRINGRLIEQLFQLAPFGYANPEPTFLSRDLEVADVRTMGEEGQHLRLRLRDGRVTWPAVAFGFGARGDGAQSVKAGDRVDVVYTFCS